MPQRQLKLCHRTLTSSWGKGPLEFSGKLIGGITQSRFCLCRWPLCFISCLGNTISSISCDSFALKYKKKFLSTKINIFWKYISISGYLKVLESQFILNNKISLEALSLSLYLNNRKHHKIFGLRCSLKYWIPNKIYYVVQLCKLFAVSINHLR